MTVSANDPVAVYGKAVAAEIMTQLRSLAEDERIGTLYCTLDTVQKDTLKKKVADLAISYAGGKAAWDKATRATQLAHLERALAASMSNDLAEKLIGLGKKYPSGVGPTPTSGYVVMGNYVFLGTTVRDNRTGTTTVTNTEQGAGYSGPTVQTTENLQTVTKGERRTWSKVLDDAQLIKTWGNQLSYQLGMQLSTDATWIKSTLAKQPNFKYVAFHVFKKDGREWAKYFDTKTGGVIYDHFNPNGFFLADIVGGVVGGVVYGAAAIPDAVWDGAKWGAKKTWEGVKWIGEKVYDGLKFVWQKVCELVTYLGRMACKIFNNSAGPLIGAAIGGGVGLATGGAAGAKVGAESGAVGAAVIQRLCGGGYVNPVMQQQTGIPLWLIALGGGAILLVALS